METAVILGVAQVVTSVVVPVTIAAAPAIWKEIIKILKNKNINRSASAGEDHHNLRTIQSTMARLQERIRDIPEWLRIPKATSLLAMLLSQANSLKTMIDKHILRTSVPSKKILSEHIKSIAVLLQRLDNNESLDVYQQRKENLRKDLLDVLSKDNLLVPAGRASSEEVTTFPRIRYEFATTQLSSSVIECIECALRWLRDFQLQSCGPERGSIDVALYEVFTEILPDALMEHLDRSLYRLDQTQIKQLLANVCFLRSFSVSSTFREIQGEAGLRMGGEEKFDLRDAGWTTWNNLQQRIKINLLPPAGNDLQQRRGGGDSYCASTSAVAETSSTRSSEIVYPDECVICGCHFQGKNQAEVDNLRERHHDKCVKREEVLLSWPSR